MRLTMTALPLATDDGRWPDVVAKSVANQNVSGLRARRAQNANLLRKDETSRARMAGVKCKLTGILRRVRMEAAMDFDRVWVDLDGEQETREQSCNVGKCQAVKPKPMDD
jgi:hypothetical protein